MKIRMLMFAVGAAFACSAQAQDPVIWDNGPGDPALGLYASQIDTAYPFEAAVADDFILD